MLCACGNKEKEYDATGTFEATEVTVFAEQSGALLTFNASEGEIISLGQEIGVVDTTQLWLKIQQLGASKRVFQSQKPDMAKQVAATRQQLVKAQQEQRRYKELVEKGETPDINAIAKDIAERDYRDMHRETSPLKQAEDAVLVDSSDLTIPEVIEKILSIVRRSTL